MNTFTKKGYEIYTDGGYSMKNDVGAYAYVVLYDGREVRRFSKKIENSTSNRAELLAITQGVLSLPEGSSVRVYSDSEYSINVLSGVYNAKVNLDIIRPFWVKTGGKYKITYEWVKGHNGDKYNEICDEMCSEAAGIDLNDFRKKVGLKVIRDSIAELSTSELTDLCLYIEKEIARRDRVMEESIINEALF